MSAKIVAFVITLIINIAIGVVIFFFLLLAMNGYGESDAGYGLGAYITLAVVGSVLMSGGAAIGVHVLMKRGFKAVTSALIAVPVFSILGAALKIVCGIIGVSVAEYVRVHY